MTTWFKFSPDGPHYFSKFVAKNDKGVKQIDLKSFKKWLKGLSLSSEKGVYIFATGEKKPKPWYVGCTTAQTFFGECGAKEAMLNKVVQTGHGAPLVYVLRAPKGNSAPLKGAIEDLETEMIRWCLQINPKLLNSKKKYPLHDTFIPGVLRARQGKPSNAALNIRNMLRLS